MCLPPTCFETGFEFVSGFEEGSSKNFSKYQKNDKVIEGEDLCLLDSNNYSRIQVNLKGWGVGGTKFSTSTVVRSCLGPRVSRSIQTY
jgi:hypothetical protein